MIILPKGLGGPDQIKKRFAAASERRELWRSILKDMYDYCIPNRETFDFHSPGDRKARHIFDSTAPESIQTFVSIMISSLTPEGVEWMKYGAGTDIPDEETKRVDEALEKATKIFFKYLSHSDFYSQVNISHQDMAISTGALLIEEGNDIDEPLLKFTAIPLPELYIEPTSLSRIHTFFRKYKVKAQEIESKFPGAYISEKLRNLINNNPTGDVDIIDGSQVYDFDTKTYHQVVLWEDEVIFHQDYGDSQPGVVYRFSKVAGESYGRGPADMAMADIRTINKVKEYLLKNAALTLSPPMLGASDGVFNPHTARIHPGAIMAVTDTSVPPLIPLQVGGDLRVGQFVIEDLQENIRKMFFADPLGDITDPVRSATENIIRQQEMLKKRGANFSRLQSEFIRPTVARITDILAKNGKIPNIKADGREVSLRMVSPISTIEQNENIDNLFVFLNAMQSIPQEVAMLGSKMELIPQFLQKNLNLPEELVKSPEEIDQAKKQLQELMASQGGQNATPV